MSSKAEKLLAKGRTLESKGKREKALDVYRDGCRALPYDPDLWSARGELAHLLGHTQEAVEALFKLCELYARGGLPAEGLTVARRVLELDPGHGGARRLRRVLEDRLAAVEEEANVEANPAPPNAPPAVPQAPPAPEPAVVAQAVEPEPQREPQPEPQPEPEAEPEVEPEAEPEPQPDSGVVEVVPVEPSRPLYVAPGRAETAREHAVGLDSRDIALDTLSLADRLPSTSPVASSGAEIVLEEEGKLDVIQAVASNLTSSPLLSELDSDLVRHLIDVGKLVHRGEEELVFRQGDVGTSLYLILAGEVSVRWEGRQRGDGQPRELARLRPGAFFGEMALLTNSGRSATVMAIKSSDFLEISRRSVRELIDRDPRILKLLMRFFRARLVGTLLQTSPVFTPFSREERRQLVSRFRLRELPAEQTVIVEGNATEGLFLVLNGKLEVLQAMKASHKKGQKGSKGGDGLSVLLGTLSPGDVFGEMSLLEGAGAMATVRTRSRCWVLLLPRAEYDALVAEHPEIKDHLATVAAERRARNETAARAQQLQVDRVEPV